MIVVFGSINLDMTMKLTRLPHVGETLLCENYTVSPGGKGANQAIAAEKMGANVKLFGKVGDDEFGQKLLNALKKSNIDLTGVTIEPSLKTGQANILLDDKGDNMIIVASGANSALKESEIPDFLLTKETTLLLQMETPAEENWKLIERAKKFGARIILNLAPATEISSEILKKIDFLIMNQVEANTLALAQGLDVISPTVTGRRVAAKHGITCIVTLGKQGAFACLPEKMWKVQALEIDPLDTTAAGDAFVGVFAASIDQGLEIPQALQRASIASGLTCLSEGAQESLPTMEAVQENIKNVPLPKLSA